MELTPGIAVALLIVVILLPFFIRDVVFRIRHGYWRDHRDQRREE